MSKYDSLWKHIQRSGEDSLDLTFDEIAAIAGLPIDHSFLNYKKELLDYGYEVGKISLKNKTVHFKKLHLVSNFSVFLVLYLKRTAWCVLDNFYFVQFIGQTQRARSVVYYL